EALLGRESNDLVLWVEGQRALVTGDTLADFGRGLELVPGWLPAGVTREAMAERLRPLLELPVELVLPAHGAPTARDELERALAGGMEQLVYSVLASLDGYVEDPSGGFDWAAPDAEVHAFVNELERPVGTHLYGRRMYETMRYWEDPPDLAGQPPHIREY